MHQASSELGGAVTMVREVVEKVVAKVAAMHHPDQSNKVVMVVGKEAAVREVERVAAIMVVEMVVEMVAVVIVVVDGVAGMGTH